MTAKLSHEIMRLNAKNSKELFKVLAAPVRFSDKLTAAFKEHAQRVTSRCAPVLDCSHL